MLSDTTIQQAAFAPTRPSRVPGEESPAGGGYELSRPSRSLTRRSLLHPEGLRFWLAGGPQALLRSMHLSGDGAAAARPEVCVVCFNRPAEILLDPCGHDALCEACVARMISTGCPICRTPIRNIAYPSSGVVRDSSVLFYEQQARDNQALAGTVQIVVLGPPRTGKKALVRRFCQLYPVPPSETVDESGNLNLSTDERAESNLATTAFVEAVNDNLRSRFSPNAMVSSTAVRLTTVSLPVHTVEGPLRGHVFEDLYNLRPDVLLFVSSYHHRAGFQDVLKWDQDMRRHRPAIPRIWVFTYKEGVESSTTLDIRDDISHALATQLPVREHPVTRFLLRPHGRYTRSIRACLKTAARYGRQTHGLEPKMHQSSASRLLHWLHGRWTASEQPFLV